MGVRGLASLVEKNGQFLQDSEFRDNNLVIDGSNLLYLLYKNADLDENHGGEYAAFEEELKKFVEALKECSIRPYVLLDGSFDPFDRKLETSNQRAAERIRRANNAALYRQKKGILPPLTREVFKQTLARLEVPLAQCYREADQEIAALATEWKCPVLSSDSDFYIFQLPAGMLPTQHFRWKEMVRRGDNSYIPCKTYSTSSFCKYFKLRSELLPTFAILSGNDYVKPRKYLPASGDGLKDLLKWLQGFQHPDKALEEALKLLRDQGEEVPDDMRSQMTMAMMEYQAPVSVMKMFFLRGVAPQLSHTEQDLVPDWIRLPLTQGRLMPEVLDLLVCKRRLLSFPVELAEFPSSNFCSQQIRQLTYGLLLGGENDLVVKERDRTDLNPNFLEVRPRVTSATRRLPLASLHEAHSSERLQVLLDVLGVTEASLSELLPQLKLPVAVTCYWLKNAQTSPNRTLLGALMQGIMGNQRAEAASLRRANTPEYDPIAAHTLNQWQMCLRDAMDLNQLLNFPLQEPEVARLFQGKLVHELLSSTDMQQDYLLPAVVRDHFERRVVAESRLKSSWSWKSHDSEDTV